MPEDVSDEIEATEPAEDSSSQPDDDASTSEGTRQSHASTENGAKGAVKGGIPRARHEEILRHTRADMEERYGWARDLDRKSVERALSLQQMLDGNPRLVQRWLNEQYKEAADDLPKPALRTEEGESLYTAAQTEQLIRKAVSEALDDVRSEMSGRVDSLEGLTREQEADRIAAAQLQEASTWAGFSDHLDAIADVIEHGQRIHRPVSLERAYLQVVLPKLRQVERKTVINELKGKSSASVSRASGSSRDVTSDADRSFADLMAEEMAARRM